MRIALRLFIPRAVQHDHLPRLKASMKLSVRHCTDTIGYSVCRIQRHWLIDSENQNICIDDSIEWVLHRTTLPKVHHDRTNF